MVGLTEGAGVGQSSGGLADNSQIEVVMYSLYALTRVYNAGVLGLAQPVSGLTEAIP